jgi:hypothetical protein
MFEWGTVALALGLGIALGATTVGIILNRPERKRGKHRATTRRRKHSPSARGNDLW